MKKDHIGILPRSLALDGKTIGDYFVGFKIDRGA
jgi:hypothetical protein